MSSEDPSPCTGARPSQNELDERSGCKRKRNQITLIEYFSKKKKPETELIEEDMEDRNLNDEGKQRRELLANAAEKRLQSSATSSSPSQTDAQSFEDFNLSQSLFSGSSMSPSDFMDEPESLDSIPTRLNRLPICAEVLHRLTVEPDHTLLIRLHFQAMKAPQLCQDQCRDIWDKNHVRMPCSKENLYPVKGKKIRKRWELIEETLLRKVSCSKDFQYLTPKQRTELFSDLLPQMASLALRLPHCCTQPIPLLKRQRSHSLTMSQEQAACLLANAFFCTFPRRNSQKYSEYSTFPDINFNRLFRGSKDVVNKTKAEKLKTLLHYFKRVTSDMPPGSLTFTRQALQKEDTPQWESCRQTFESLYVSSKGTIEDDGSGFLQVDFANRLVGGGVIGEGCVQEEIRFLICPELILSRLFVERLDPNECLVVKGAERFSSYAGYAQTYRWDKDFIDLTPRDRWGRRYTEVVAVDAHVFNIYAHQFKPAMLKRELNKAYCGFHNPKVDPVNLPAIATGNWGCGAFGGDARLKALIQLMAAAVASRQTVYFTFGDEYLREDLVDFYEFLLENSISVGVLWQLIQKYERELEKQGEHIALYPCLKTIYFDYNVETDNDDEGIRDGNDKQSEMASDKQDEMVSEAPGCLPGEAASNGSPDYKDETP
eukprot:gene16702-18396_t